MPNYGGIEFSSQADYEEHKKRKLVEVKVNRMIENLIWLAETYLKLYKDIRLDNIDSDNMYIVELYDYMVEYRESLKRELGEVYNGLLVTREYCNNSMIPVDNDVVVLINQIEALL